MKLTVSLFLLGTSTVSIAVLPGYGAAGWLAIVGLIACRIGQGLALGGSWDGLPSLLAINAPEGRRGWYGMLGQLGCTANWHRISREWLYDEPPITELGKAHHAWLAEHPPVAPKKSRTRAKKTTKAARPEA